MIAIGADHGGYELKEKIKKHYYDKIVFKDFGTNSLESVDYPEIAYLVANSVANSKDFADHMKDENRKAKDRETKWAIYGDITGNASSIVRKIDDDYMHNLPDIIVSPSDQRYFNIQGLPEFPIK